MWPLVAMENALFGDPSLGWERRCALVAEAGFAGIYAVPYPLGDDDFVRLATLDVVPARHGLRVAGVYANIDLALAPDAPWNARVRRLFEIIAGVSRVELSFKCSVPSREAPAWEEAIVARLEPLLAVAERRGLEVALYPHAFYPLETVPQAERVVQRIAHPRLGFVFPVSHTFALCSAEETARQLRACANRLAGFNVCGCRQLAPQPPAKCAHFPPDEGDLEIAPLMAVLREEGYRGDIVVQGHGWQGDLPGMLRRAAAYPGFRKEIAASSLPREAVDRTAPEARFPGEESHHLTS